MARAELNVYGIGDGAIAEKVMCPGVFSAALRTDVVQDVFKNMSKNRRQAYAVRLYAGRGHSAQSWGPGRAVARIPRVRGGGTHRSGEGAFGNMCRGGSMFNPTTPWRRWHRLVPTDKKRHAMASAIAASSCAALVLAKGHRAEGIPELPLVVSDDLQKLDKTRSAVAALEKLGCGEDLRRAADRSIRAGRGKSRGRKYVGKLGPLIVHASADGQCERTFRNVPGVDLCHVERLSLLKMAPGGVVGRLVIWTKSAVAALHELWGTADVPAPLKKGFQLAKPAMANPDLGALINSDAVQSLCRAPRRAPLRRTQLKNLLTNRVARCKVDPAYKIRARIAKARATPGTKEHAAVQALKKKRQQGAKQAHKASRKYYNTITQSFTDVQHANIAQQRQERLALLHAAVDE